ncbi:hypothetical protein ACFVFJ_44635 [Streptomyces sp. NPDC057717]|uniref:hypothetical protein n=1 Tax=Streptomyces sp. NPDC057717 TaxID=3346224 RepID=UPI0036BDA622
MKNPIVATGLHRYTRAQLRHDRDAARAECRRLDGVIRGLDVTVIEQGEEIARLKADAVDVSVERQLRVAAEAKARGIEEQLRAVQAAADNANSVTVPAGRRDIDPDDMPTEPAGIHVGTLRAALSVA